ncbi:hypothetical protein AB0G83_04315 [Streptomyces klenkii]|uniref:hypothetical protein n=1 Tax=Streptomyces klenkii TaxID=1420899 RepID=UPI003407319A
MFGKSKDSGRDGARVVRNKDKTASEDVKVVCDKRGRTSLSGRYEARCDDHGYSLKGLPKKDAKAFAEIHDAERHGRR